MNFSFFLLLNVFVAGTVVAQPEKNDAIAKNIVIYGASGNFGSVFVEEGLSRGHKIVGVSRNPEKLKVQHEKFSAVAGDVTEYDSVLATITDADVVIVSVRGVDKSKKPENTTQVKAAENMIAASRALGDAAPRIIQVGGGATLYVGDVQLFHKLPLPIRLFIRKGTEGYAIMRGHYFALESYRQVDDIKWTVATPAPGTSPRKRGERTGQFRLGTDNILVEPTGFSPSPSLGRFGKLSVADLAVAIFNEVEQAQFINKRFTAAY
ncbi:MAG: NAD(P)-dependent oxidoreductase [Pseudomonadales bacterium]